MFYKFSPMTVFKPRTSGGGSEPSSNWATTIALPKNSFIRIELFVPQKVTNRCLAFIKKQNLKNKKKCFDFDSDEHFKSERA